VSATFETTITRSQADAGLTSVVSYPSYKSFDEFIDTERLRSLDGYISERIRRHIRLGHDSFFLNEHRLERDSPYQPGVREIWLSRTKPGVPYNYLDLDDPSLWEVTEAATEFTLLMDFIATLPFKATGRMLIIYDDGGRAVPAHRDHDRTDICNEFVWFRTNLRKPFYMLNNDTNEKVYVESYSAWFDSVNQYHGSDPADGLTFSIRVDGLFTDEFRQRIPKPDNNLASTPSYWAGAANSRR
jgi:hypothetical protein